MRFDKEVCFLFRRNRFLFRKQIEPRCAYCAHAVSLDERSAACRKKGVVPLEHACRAFRYDPLRRVPPKPAVLRGHYSDEDFLLEEDSDPCDP